MNDERIVYISENLDRISKRDRIFLNNPVIMQGLGLAPIIVPATNIQNASIIAVAVLLLLTPTRIIATWLSRHVSEKWRAIVYVLTAGVLYILIAYLMDAFMFGTKMNLVGVYLPLLVVEPLVVKRYSSANREGIGNSFKKGILTTVGFCLVLFIVAGLRELLAFGTLSGIVFTKSPIAPVASTVAGGFIIMGLVAAIWRSLVNLFKKKINMGVKKLQ